MNDAESSATAGGGSSSGSYNENLNEIARELQEVIADTKIMEQNDASTDCLVVDSTNKFHDLGLDAEEVVKQGDGTFIVTTSSRDRRYYPRDSAGWKAVHDSYQSVHDGIVSCGKYDFLSLTAGMAHMESAVKALDQGTDFSSVSKDMKNQEVLTEDGLNDLRGKFDTGQSPWHDAGEASTKLENWTGRAASVFRAVYLNQLPVILVGQMAVAKALYEALTIAEATFLGAYDDGQKLAQAGIDSLEGTDTGSIDVNWTEGMTMIYNLSALAAGVAAVIPGAQPLAAVLTLSAGASGFAAYVAGKVEKNSGSGEILIEATSADGVASDIKKQVEKIHQVVEDIEKTTGELLQQFYDMVTSSEKGADVSTAWDDVSLTVRETYFEPRSPGKEAGHGNGLSTVGKAATNDKSGNDPTYDDLRDGVMGTTGHTGAVLGLEIDNMWEAGNKHIPNLADRYGDVASTVGSGDSGVETSFTRDGGSGTLYPAWVQLHEELLNILKGSDRNLVLVGAALCLAAEEYANQDAAAAAEIRKNHDGELPWETK